MKFILFFLFMNYSFASCDALFHGNLYLYKFLTIDSIDIPGKSVYTESATNDGFFYREKFEHVIDGEVVGEIYFKLYKDSNKLFISDIHVYKKRMGVSSVLISKAIMKHPEVETIRSVLGLDNFEAFHKAFTLTDSSIAAIKSTPAFKSRKRLGFSRLDDQDVDIDWSDSSVTFEVHRD
jgi:hypothetical protein